MKETVIIPLLVTNSEDNVSVSSRPTTCELE